MYLWGAKWALDIKDHVGCEPACRILLVLVGFWFFSDCSSWHRSLFSLAAYQVPEVPQQIGDCAGNRKRKNAAEGVCFFWFQGTYTVFPSCQPGAGTWVGVVHGAFLGRKRNCWRTVVGFAKIKVLLCSGNIQKMNKCIVQREILERANITACHWGRRTVSASSEKRQGVVWGWLQKRFIQGQSRGKSRLSSDQLSMCWSSAQAQCLRKYHRKGSLFKGCRIVGS